MSMDSSLVTILNGFGVLIHTHKCCKMRRFVVFANHITSVVSFEKKKKNPVNMYTGLQLGLIIVHQSPLF